MVTSPLVMHDVKSAARTRRAHGGRTRFRQAGSLLAYSRLRRAWKRQWPVLVVSALAVGGIGAVVVMAGSLSQREALLFFAPAALLAGLSVALILELSRNTVTSVASLGKHADYTVLGAAPVLTRQALRGLPPDQRTPLGSLAFMPASSYATAFRELQQSLAGDKIVAFIAPIAGEGASTAALCAAVSAVQQRRRTILIDCDVRHRGFTTALEHDPAAGVLEACEHPDDWRQFVDEEVETGLHFIPAARPRTAWRTLAASPGLPLLLERLRADYDLIVLDCPPALSSADGPVAARLADRCVVVAAWDNTPISAIRNTVRLLRARGRIATNIFMNRVPPEYRYSRPEATR